MISKITNYDTKIYLIFSRIITNKIFGNARGV